jgi:octaprenyl-diphosphate synthase
MMISLSEDQNPWDEQLVLTMEDVFGYVEEDLRRVEQVLRNGLSSEVSLIPQVGRYVFESGGKRMRPLLTILSSRLCGYQGNAHVIMAAVTELIHTATLLHDDVVDHADLRRGSRSVNSLWSSETSILIGDFLFTRSFCMMVEHGDMRILELMSKACNQLAEGEILELAKSGDPGIGEDDYLAIVRDKTAVLISAACRLGPILGEKPEWEGDLSLFGMNLGVAFQLVDDVLDYAAEEEELGKTIGKDIQEGKVTLPIIRTLGRCTALERKRLMEVIRSRSVSQKEVHEILETVQNYDGLQYTQQMACRFVEEAKARLMGLPASKARAAMLAVADFVAARKR